MKLRSDYGMKKGRIGADDWRTKEQIEKQRSDVIKFLYDEDEIGYRDYLIREVGCVEGTPKLDGLLRVFRSTVAELHRRREQVGR